MQFRFVVIKVIGPFLLVAFFAFVPIPQFVVFQPTLNVWNLTITGDFTSAKGMLDGRTDLSSDWYHHWHDITT
jgi:hypothetical protein